MAKSSKTRSKATAKTSKSAAKSGRSAAAAALTQKVMTTKVSKSKKSATASALTQKSATGRFVLGRQAFARISAVEGVVLSKSMTADLRRLEDASPAERRLVLSGKYGKG